MTSFIIRHGIAKRKVIKGADEVIAAGIRVDLHGSDNAASEVESDFTTRRGENSDGNGRGTGNIATIKVNVEIYMLTKDAPAAGEFDLVIRRRFELVWFARCDHDVIDTVVVAAGQALRF